MPTERNKELALQAHRLLRTIIHCSYCRREGTELMDPDREVWHMDHIVPLCQGGPDSLYNLTKCCAACNYDKGGELWTRLTQGIIRASDLKREPADPKKRKKREKGPIHPAHQLNKDALIARRRQEWEEKWAREDRQTALQRRRSVP